MDDEEFRDRAMHFAAQVEGMVNRMMIDIAVQCNQMGMNPGVFYAGSMSAFCSEVSKIIVSTSGPEVARDEKLLEDATRIIREFIVMSRAEWDKKHAAGECQCQHHDHPEKVVDELIAVLMRQAKAKGSEKKEGE